MFCWQHLNLLLRKYRTEFSTNKCIKRHLPSLTVFCIQQKLILNGFSIWSTRNLENVRQQVFWLSSNARQPLRCEISHQVRFPGCYALNPNCFDTISIKSTSAGEAERVLSTTTKSRGIRLGSLPEFCE